MDKLPRYVDIDYSKYAPDIPEDQLETYYGLPQKVQFCKECVMSNQKPNSCYEFEHTIHSIKKTMVIQEDGVCDACHACHNKANGHIDWALREKELRELCDQYRKTDGSYDCLVPGSGGKDSFYAAHLLKYKYGMHPLTVTWAPHIYTPWGWENMQAWIHAGFDNYLCTPNGMTHRLLTRLATENLFHPFQPFILGQKQLAPKMAAKFGIPLVFYGENEAEFGNPIADNESALRDEHFFAVNDYDHIYLGGVSLRQLQEDYKIDPADLAIYLPGETSNLEKNHVQVRYLGHPGHLLQVQLHRRQDRRFLLLHHLHQVRHRPHQLRRRPGDPQRRDHAGGRPGPVQKVRRRIPRPVRKGDLPLPEPGQAALPLGQPAV